MRPLEGQTLLVTGSTDGLGRRFLLTQLSLPKLREPGRILNGYEPFRAYAQSKLAQILFTFDLAERLDGRDITVNALHPASLMDTKMVREGPPSPMRSVEEGLEATLRLVADPGLDGVTGRFVDGRRESRAHAQAYDADARRLLWDESERLTGLS
jgi:NAD(P)-dependent dehydrogenase (short-subunit alcohol dehydrogenase family)